MGTAHATDAAIRFLDALADGDILRRLVPGRLGEERSDARMNLVCSDKRRLPA